MSANNYILLTKPNLVDALLKYAPFHNSTLTVKGYPNTPGRYLFSSRLHDSYYDHVRMADYIILSYGTPIAWHRTDGWFIPDETYSATTSKHQSYIRAAINEIEGY